MRRVQILGGDVAGVVAMNGLGASKVGAANWGGVRVLSIRT